MASPALEVRGLTVSLPAGSDRRFAVKDAGFDLNENEILCVVGESGSGKTLMARAIMGLLPGPAVYVSGGEIEFEGEDLLAVSDVRMREIRGSSISMIFQEPMTALNPLMTIGEQIAEVLHVHTDLSAERRRERVLAILEAVYLPDPPAIFSAFAHQLSGGQRQRAMIAMALILEPKIIIADEPTTALDVTTQAQILKLIAEIQRKHGTSVLYITHDFGVVAEIADRVAVMNDGEIVELGVADDVLNRPKVPYTQSLIAAVPDLKPPARPRYDKGNGRAGEVVLEATGLRKTFVSGGGLFGGHRREVQAVRHANFQLRRGETIGIVGESGSGKSTLARLVIRLISADAGEVLIDGLDILKLSGPDMRRYRGRIQMVFQDPFASLNPRYKVGRIIAEGPLQSGLSRRAALRRVHDLLDLVGLDKRAVDRFPHEFSGGQRQRIGIARALALDPEILIADEPVSALDVSVQDQILRLFADIQKRSQLAIMFITHDLCVAAQVCDRIAVMCRGEIVEQGLTAEVFAAPQHDYTRTLLASVPGQGRAPGGSAIPGSK